MQAIGKGVCNAGRASLSLQPHQIASSSRVQWDSRRCVSFRSPMQWLREKVTPTIQKRRTNEEFAAAREKLAEEGKQSVFDKIPEDETKPVAIVEEKAKKIFTEHKYSTSNFKISPRKLNMLGRQIAGKPIDHAILQMMFSDKRASKRIKSMLAVARDHAVNYKNLDKSKLVVAEAWVTKGPKYVKRLDPRGRGHFGIRTHPDARMSVVLKEGKTFEQKKKEERARQLKRIVSAGLVRENVPLRNPGPMWGW